MIGDHHVKIRTFLLGCCHSHFRLFLSFSFLSLSFFLCLSSTSTPTHAHAHTHAHVHANANAHEMKVDKASEHIKEWNRYRANEWEWVRACVRDWGAGVVLEREREGGVCVSVHVRVRVWPCACERVREREQERRYGSFNHCRRSEFWKSLEILSRDKRERFSFLALVCFCFCFFLCLLFSLSRLSSCLDVANEGRKETGDLHLLPIGRDGMGKIRWSPAGHPIMNELLGSIATPGFNLQSTY